MNTKETRKQQKEIAKFEAAQIAKKNQPKVSEIIINISWSKAGNPTANARVISESGVQNYTAKAGGYGYCKESTVIAEIFNNCMAYKLFELDEQTKKPYGISFYNREHGLTRYYAGGVGTSCYYDIVKFFGGVMKHSGWGKEFDSYIITF
jgi:hypothetical protein